MRGFGRLLLWAAPVLIVCAIVARWGAGTWQAFRRFGVYADVEPFQAELGRWGQRDLHWRLRAARLALAHRGAAPHLRQFHIEVDPVAVDRLDEDLPYSGREYVDARAGFGAASQGVRLRYRGDTLVHWGYAKKSWRLVAAGDGEIDGLSRCNLIVGKHPDQIDNHLSYRLAEQLGLLAPRSEPVEVHVNGALRGLSWFVEQVDEDMLIRRGRADGVLFVGEMIKRDAWNGGPRSLFDSAALWEARDVGAGCPRARPALRELLELLQSPLDEATTRRIGELLHLREFARFSVFELLTQTHHFDTIHNWRLFWESATQRFVPIVWDPVGWSLPMRPPDGRDLDLWIAPTPLHARLYADARFLVLRAELLSGFFRDGGVDALRTELEKTLEETRLAIARDPCLLPPDDEQVAAARRDLAAFVQRCLDDVHRARTAPGSLTFRRPSAPGEGLRLALTTNTPVNGLAVSLPEDAAPTRVILRTRRPDGPSDTDLAGRWRLDGNELLVDLPLASALLLEFEWWKGAAPIRNCRRVVETTTYELVLEGADPGQVSAVRELGGARRGFAEDDEVEMRPLRDLFCIVP